MDTRYHSKRKIVVALGGNALSSPENRDGFKEQIKSAEKSAEILAGVAKEGYKMVITHGNGPQVGNILLQQEIAKKNVPPMPLSVCVAQSQGQIGTMLTEALNNELQRLNSESRAVTIVSHILVDIEDTAFKNPTKPIGPFYEQNEADELRKGGMVLKEIKPGIFRRVVPSPLPLEILEIKAIKNLLDSNFIPICVGGGGVPVMKTEKELKAVDAVIDKDLASEVLAISIGADWLVILTNVKSVALNFGTKKQKWLKKLSLREAKRYLKVGQFPAGSMGPKIGAAIKFLEKGGEKVFIGHLYELRDILKGKSGTIIM